MAHWTLEESADLITTSYHHQSQRYVSKVKSVFFCDTKGYASRRGDLDSTATRRDCRNSQLRMKDTSRYIAGSWPLHRPHENGVDDPRGSRSWLGAPAQLGPRYPTVQNAHSYSTYFFTQFRATQPCEIGS